MKNFIKLVRFELNRFFPIYVALGILTTVIQFLGVFILTQSYKGTIKDYFQMGATDSSEIVSAIGRMGLSKLTETLFFIAPIAICVVTLLLYTLFIWYRDWFGKNTFIYRLLMLPTNRLNLFFSKAVTIFLMVLGLIAFQLVLLFIEGQLFSLLIPEAFLETDTLQQVIQKSVYLGIFYPDSWLNFMVNYGTGFVAVLVLFTLVLFERSFKIKGLVMAGIYGVLVLVIQFFPYWIQMWALSQLFFSSELFWLSLVLSCLIGVVSVWVSYRLLNKRVTV